MKYLQYLLLFLTACILILSVIATFYFRSVPAFIVGSLLSLLVYKIGESLINDLKEDMKNKRFIKSIKP